MWFNFHSHSKYCDGKGELREYVDSAKSHQLFTMGFSSHAPLPFDCEWSMKEDDLQTYMSDIETLKHENKGIEIYKSLEIDFVPGVASPYHFRDMLDYTIGSIHFVDKLPDGRHWEIDNSQEIFDEGAEKIFNNNYRDIVHRYFELTKEMIFSGSPDIVGHLDKIKIQNKDGKYFNESDAWYKEEIEDVLKLIQKAGLIIEVNTRGIYQKKTTTTYPGEWILQMVREKNIPVTLSSDAHLPQDIVSQFGETAAMLKRIGFRELSVFTEGKWKKLPFDENGIVR